MSDYTTEVGGLDIHADMSMEGMREALMNLEFGERELHNLAQKACLAVSAEVRKRIRLYAPVGRRGVLRKAFKNKAKRKWPTLLRADVIVYKGESRKDPKGAWYWHFVEHGTVHQKARKYVEMSLKQVEPIAMDTFRKKVVDAATKAMEKRAK
jgi:HK97 gp10 family phage protein